MVSRRLVQPGSAGVTGRNKGWGVGRRSTRLPCAPLVLCSTEGRGRTDTPVRTADFESPQPLLALDTGGHPRPEQAPDDATPCPSTSRVVPLDAARGKPRGKAVLALEAVVAALRLGRVDVALAVAEEGLRQLASVDLDGAAGASRNCD